jgi:hypothetical protein
MRQQLTQSEVDYFAEHPQVRAEVRARLQREIESERTRAVADAPIYVGHTPDGLEAASTDRLAVFRATQNYGWAHGWRWGQVLIDQFQGGRKVGREKVPMRVHRPSAA